MTHEMALARGLEDRIIIVRGQGMSSVEERIEKMLIRWLLAEKDIVAAEAYFAGTNSAMDDGCDTCGDGGTEMNFDICYKRVGGTKLVYLEIQGDPLNFLPELLKYDI